MYLCYKLLFISTQILMNVLMIMVDVREYALIWKDSSPAVVEMVSSSTQMGEGVMVRYNICTI